MSYSIFRLIPGWTIFSVPIGISLMSIPLLLPVSIPRPTYCQKCVLVYIEYSLFFQA